MYAARFYFHAELNDFLPAGKRETCLAQEFKGTPSVKHLIESLGIPHTEVGHILVNGTAVGFDYLVQDGDQVEVFSNYESWFSETIDGRSADRKGSRPCFILDNHLGRLATYLRMLGFDTLYRNDFQDQELARVTSQQGRILLTRDRRLLMRSVVVRGYWVREKAPRLQLVEVMRRFHLFAGVQPFRRCTQCNSLLTPVSKEAVLHRLEPLTRLYFHEFRRCPNCERVYWKGSHYERMQQFIDQVIAEGLGKSSR